MVGVEFKELPLGKLAMNTGQLEGVPANPRQWTQADVDKLARSISETPELLQARGAIVVPHGKRYVVLGGNMRVTAAKALGLEAVPCAVLPEGTPAEKLREIVIKDNSSFGAWDMDALANEWDDLPLVDWGVPAWDTSAPVDLDALRMDTIAEAGESRSGYSSVTFLFKQEDAASVNDWIKENGKETLAGKIVEICQKAEAK